MNRVAFTAIVFFILATLVCKNSRSDVARVVIAVTESVSPPLDDVVVILGDHLDELGVKVELIPWRVDEFFSDKNKWFSVAQKADESGPGMIALFGYDCQDRSCRLVIVQPRQDSIIEIPVEVSKFEPQGEAFGLAATIREALVGPLLPEIERLVHEGQDPDPPPPPSDKAWIKPPFDKDRDRQQPRPRLWFEGGYRGEIAYPGGHPIHGPWLGVSASPKSVWSGVFSMGWLGIRDENSDAGFVKTNRLTTSLALRINFSLGPAMVSVAPVGRFDAVFSKQSPIDGEALRKSDLEIHLGAMTSWHLPLPAKLEAIVGAGILATVLSNDYELNGADVLAASRVRVVWQFGIAWSPLN